MSLNALLLAVFLWLVIVTWPWFALAVAAVLLALVAMVDLISAARRRRRHT